VGLTLKNEPLKTPDVQKFDFKHFAHPVGAPNHTYTQIMRYLLLALCLWQCRPHEPAAPPAPISGAEVLRQADSLFDIRQFSYSLSRYRRADSLLAHAPQQRVYCRRKIAASLWRTHQPDSAMALCKALLPQARALLGDGHPEVAQIMIVQGNTLVDLRTDEGFEASLQHYWPALRLLEAWYPPQHPEVALGYGRLGMAHWLHDDYPSSIQYYRHALRHLDSSSAASRPARARLLSHLGLVTRSAGMYRQALHCFSTAYALDLTNQPNTLTSYNLMEMAQTQVEMGESEAALRHLHRAWAIEQALGDSGTKTQCYILETMGNAYTALQQTDSAIHTYRQCLAYWNPEDASHTKGYTQDMHLLGDALLLSGDAQQAIRCFQLAGKVSAKHYGTHNFNHVPLLRSLGQAYSATGQHALARRCLQDALAVSLEKAGAHHPETGDVHQGLAQLDLLENRYAAALAQATAAQQSYRTPPAQHVSDYLGLVRAKHLEGRIRFATIAAQPADIQAQKQCITALREAVHWADSTRRHLDAAPADQLEVQKEVVAIAETALAALHHFSEKKAAPAPLSDVLFFMEKSKAAALRATFQQLQARRTVGIPEAWAVQEAAYKAKVRSAFRVLQENNSSSSADAAARLRSQENYAAALAAADSFERTLSQEYPQYHALKSASPEPDLARLQQIATGRHSAIVSYFFGKNDCYALALTPRAGEGRWMRLGASADIEQRIGTLLGSVRAVPKMTDSDSVALVQMQQFCQAAQGLYLQIMGPLGLEREACLTIIPDGPLYAVPFEALLPRPAPDASVRGLDYRSLPYLIRSQAVLLENSAELLTVEPKKPQPVHYVGFAPGYAHGPLPDLPHNAQEIAAAQAILGGQIFEGATTDEASVYRAAEGANVLHFACHAVMDARHHEQSALVFAPTSQGAVEDNDNRLHWYELYNQNWKVGLAVLSACHTNDGTWERGEGVASLSAAFRYAGCAAVLSGRWKVNDASSSEVVTGFLQHLKSGRDKPAAYQSAACDYLDHCSSSQRCHPFYWATFALCGSPDPIFEEKTERDEVFWAASWAALVGGCSMAALYLLWMSRSKFRAS